jgi:hypothetical protein
VRDGQPTRGDHPLVSLPNFYFHAVTAYDILRSRGVPIGKRDYEGLLRTRGARTHRRRDALPHPTV